MAGVFRSSPLLIVLACGILLMPFVLCMIPFALLQPNLIQPNLSEETVNKITPGQNIDQVLDILGIPSDVQGVDSDDLNYNTGGFSG